jgi:hypothetical protein
MSAETEELRERSEDVEDDWEAAIAERADDGGGCMELAEMLSEMREE